MTEPGTLPRELHHDDVQRIRVDLAAGTVDITRSADEATHVYLDGDAGDPQVREFAARTRLTVVGDELYVETPRNQSRAPELRLRIETPVTPAVRLSTGAADLRVDTPLGNSNLNTGSGDIELERIEGRLDANAGSGDIVVGAVTEALSANTGSGDIRIGSHGGTASCSTGSGDVRISESVGPVKVKVGSGDITIERVRSHSVATSGSGDVRLEAAEGPSVVAESARGDVQVGVPAGTPTYLDLQTVTGDIRCDLEPSDQPAEGEKALALRARTVSGDILITRV